MSGRSQKEAGSVGAMGAAMGAIPALGQWRSAMENLPRIGASLEAALAMGVPRELVVTTLMTSHRGRLSKMLRLAAQRFLVAHRYAQAHPRSAVALRDRKREKALLDLVRYRLAAVGLRREAPVKAIKLMDARPRLIESRRAA